VHTYSYDVVGRLTTDAVTTLGTSVDGTVRRIEYAYDGQGNPYLVTSYDSYTGGSVVNQVQRAYDGLGNLIQEWQATSGTVNTLTTPSVQYAYAFLPSGSNNTDRLTSITYPNGRVITYNYASGVDDAISRLTSISDGGTALETDSYLGLVTVVKRAQGSGITLDYTTTTAVSQGPKDGTSATSNGAGTAWTNPSNALTSDSSFATATLGAGATSQLLTVTGFNFSVPSSAAVVGLSVNVERKATGILNGGNIRDNVVQLVSGGVAVGSNKAITGTNWPTTGAVQSYGGSSDTWGAGLTAANVNASGFGVEVQAKDPGTGKATATANVNDIQVTVYYTLPNDGGDIYTGLDRFGRVIDQAWVNVSGVGVDRTQYGYDRDSNRLFASNALNSARSELYAYDGLNQLTSFQRGTLTAAETGLVGSASRSQSWVTDAVGNFTSQVSDGTTQTRTENKQNEITSVSGATTPTYSSAGEMTGDETGKQFVYDAWGRLAVVKNSGGTTLATYRYDGLGRRVRDIEASTTDFYYSSAWQVLEEDVAGSMVNSYVWSPVYVDALIARDSGGTRLYTTQDSNFNLTALVNTSGTVVERYAYDAYGTQSVMDASWGSRSGSSYAWVYGFQGLRLDGVSGDYNARNRELASNLGVWGRNDPTGPAGGDGNLFRAESDSPVNSSDPSGLLPFPRPVRPDGKFGLTPEEFGRLFGSSLFWIQLKIAMVQLGLLQDFPKLGMLGKDFIILAPGGGTIEERPDRDGYMCYDHTSWYVGAGRWNGKTILTPDQPAKKEEWEDYLSKHSKIGKPRLIYDGDKDKKLDCTSCKGKVMVAIFATPFAIPDLSHICIRTPDGRWISKLSGGLLIEHKDPTQLEGEGKTPGFGRVWRVYCIDPK
jgi:RHS repeat-associated protein